VPRAEEKPRGKLPEPPLPTHLIAATPKRAERNRVSWERATLASRSSWNWCAGGEGEQDQRSHDTTASFSGWNMAWTSRPASLWGHTHLEAAGEPATLRGETNLRVTQKHRVGTWHDGPTQSMIHDTRCSDDAPSHMKIKEVRFCVPQQPWGVPLVEHLCACTFPAKLCRLNTSLVTCPHSGIGSRSHTSSATQQQ
jgi:hypothetical protein